MKSIVCEHSLKQILKNLNIGDKKYHKSKQNYINIYKAYLK